MDSCELKGTFLEISKHFLFQIKPVGVNVVEIYIQLLFLSKKIVTFEKFCCT
jgi:hypothetical protein